MVWVGRRLRVAGGRLWVVGGRCGSLRDDKLKEQGQKKKQIPAG
jgi:hypothetical protein